MYIGTEICNRQSDCFDPRSDSHISEIFDLLAIDRRNKTPFLKRFCKCGRRQTSVMRLLALSVRGTLLKQTCAA